MANLRGCKYQVLSQHLYYMAGTNFTRTSGSIHSLHVQGMPAAVMKTWGRLLHTTPVL
jgi:hypothetical protein